MIILGSYLTVDCKGLDLTEVLSEFLMDAVSKQLTCIELI